MSDFEPKPAPNKRAQVFRGARERIVKTDAVVHKTKEQLLTEQRQHANTRHSRDLLASVISDPVHKAFLDSLYRQVGAMMADAALEQMKETLEGRDVGAAVIERMRYYAREAGDDISDNVLGAFLPRAEVDTSAREFYDEAQTVIESRIVLPRVEVRYARAFNRGFK